MIRFLASCQSLLEVSFTPQSSGKTPDTLDFRPLFLREAIAAGKNTPAGRCSGILMPAEEQVGQEEDLQGFVL